MRLPRLLNKDGDARLATVAAYAFFLLAGWAVITVLCGLLSGWDELLRMLRHPLGGGFWLLVPPGPAAALGAAAVHRSFMRAVHAGLGSYAHGWAAVGVLAAHAAYAVLMLPTFMLSDHYLRDQLLAHHQFISPLGELFRALLTVGSVSLLFGFLPNLLIAEVFAGVVVHRHERRSVPDAGKNQEGECDVSATFAE